MLEATQSPTDTAEDIDTIISVLLWQAKIISMNMDEKIEEDGIQIANATKFLVHSSYNEIANEESINGYFHGIALMQYKAPNSTDKTTDCTCSNPTKETEHSSEI